MTNVASQYSAKGIQELKVVELVIPGDESVVQTVASEKGEVFPTGSGAVTAAVI